MIRKRRGARESGALVIRKRRAVVLAEFDRQVSQGSPHKWRTTRETIDSWMQIVVHTEYEYFVKRDWSIAAMRAVLQAFLENAPGNGLREMAAAARWSAKYDASDEARSL